MVSDLRYAWVEHLRAVHIVSAVGYRVDSIRSRHPPHSVSRVSRPAEPRFVAISSTPRPGGDERNALLAHRGPSQSRPLPTTIAARRCWPRRTSIRGRSPTWSNPLTRKRCICRTFARRREDRRRHADRHDVSDAWNRRLRSLAYCWTPGGKLIWNGKPAQIRRRSRVPRRRHAGRQGYVGIQLLSGPRAPARGSRAGCDRSDRLGRGDRHRQSPIDGCANLSSNANSVQRVPRALPVLNSHDSTALAEPVARKILEPFTFSNRPLGLLADKVARRRNLSPMAAAASAASRWRLP